MHSTRCDFHFLGSGNAAYLEKRCKDMCVFTTLLVVLVRSLALNTSEFLLSIK